MKKIYLSLTFVFEILLSFAQTQTPNSISPSGKRSWAGTDSAGVYTFVEQNPEFPGGDAALIRFLQQNIKYPQMERDSGIKGNVLIRFVIMENGKVDSVKVFKGVDAGLDSEAVRVVKMLPDFVPGRQQGKPVKVYFNLPIVFKL